MAATAIIRDDSPAPAATCGPKRQRGWARSQGKSYTLKWRQKPDAAAQFYDNSRGN